MGRGQGKKHVSKNKYIPSKISFVACPPQSSPRNPVCPKMIKGLPCDTPALTISVAAAQLVDLPQHPSVMIPPISLKRRRGRVFFVGRGQFILRTKVNCQHEVRTPRIPIDTGAQHNLVRKGLFPSSFFKESPHPLSLTAANEGPVS